MWPWKKTAAVCGFTGKKPAHRAGTCTGFLPDSEQNQVPDKKAKANPQETPGRIGVEPRISSIHILNFGRISTPAGITIGTRLTAEMVDGEQ
jgi:hypothetical protein